MARVVLENAIVVTVLLIAYICQLNFSFLFPLIRLEWELDGIKDDLKEAKESIVRMIDDSDLVVISTSYGKRFPKKVRLSPDGWFQVGVAYWHEGGVVSQQNYFVNQVTHTSSHTHIMHTHTHKCVHIHKINTYTHSSTYTPARSHTHRWQCSWPIIASTRRLCSRTSQLPRGSTMKVVQRPSVLFLSILLTL